MDPINCGSTLNDYTQNQNITPDPIRRSPPFRMPEGDKRTEDVSVEYGTHETDTGTRDETVGIESVIHSNHIIGRRT